MYNNNNQTGEGGTNSPYQNAGHTGSPYQPRPNMNQGARTFTSPFGAQGGNVNNQAAPVQGSHGGANTGTYAANQTGYMANSGYTGNGAAVGQDGYQPSYSANQVSYNNQGGYNANQGGYASNQGSYASNQGAANGGGAMGGGNYAGSYGQAGNAYGPDSLNQLAGQFVPNEILENPMMQVGLAQTSKAMAGTMDKLAPGMSGFWGSLKFYFAVDGAYVVRKLKLLLFPFRHADWKRQGSGAEPGQLLPPTMDVNCPDLYIPIMAILTHTLLLSLLKGQYMRFTPEVISDTLSSSFVSLTLEVLMILAGNWALQSHGGKFPIVEVGIYSSYKYVGVAINMLVGLFLGFTLFMVMSFYTASTSAFFLCKSLSSRLPTPMAKRTKFFIFALAALDFLIVFYLGYSSEIGKSTAPAFLQMSSGQPSVHDDIEP